MHPFVSLLARRPSARAACRASASPPALDVPGGAWRDRHAAARVAGVAAGRGHSRRHPPPPAVRLLPRAHELPVHQALAPVGDPLGHADRAQPRARWSSAASTSASTSRAAPSWQVHDGATARPRASPRCATSSSRSASPTPRSATLSGSSGESVHVQAQIVEDPIRTIQQTLADTSSNEVADVQFARNDDGGGTFTFRRPPTRR